MTRLLLTHRALSQLRSHFRRRELPCTPVTPDGRVEDIDIAWATSDLYTDRDLARHFFGALLGSETLRWLQVSNAGVDHPVFADLVRRGVTVTTSHVTGVPIAEYVLRAVLDHFQGAEQWRSSIAARRWEVHEFREVLGTTWLIIGLGAIGSAVATRARAFGARVIGVRRTPRGDEPVDALVTPDGIIDALRGARVVVLAAPATSATIGLVDSRFLLSMRPGSVLVNVARGSLVDETALLAALERGVPEVAILDVTANEPPPVDSPLWSHPRVVLTPHSSALGHGRHARALAVFVENLERYLAGEPLSNIVTEEELSN